MQSSAAELRVNTGLRDMIQRQTTLASADASVATTGTFISKPCSVTMSHAPAPAGTFIFHCAVTPPTEGTPTEGTKQPIVAILCLDLSGSMGTSLANPTNEKGAKLFTRLDLAKHVCVTTAHMLGDEDVLCIIGFSTASSVVLKPTLMTAAGKEKTEQLVKTVKADGGTNIWSALQLINKVSNKPEFAGRNIVAALLTDGETNPETSPRRGEVESYRLMSRPEKLSVFGFSYDINSKLLYQLASVSNCTFGFIPDFSMVGTVFINWMATAVSTASLERTVKVTYKDGTSSEHKTGLIQFGQTRNIVLTSNSEPVSVSLDSDAELASTSLEQLSPMAQVRFELLNMLQFCIAHDGVGVDYTPVYRKWSSSSDLQVKELMRDIKPAGSDDEGQVSMAAKSPTIWTKWGKHYTRAYYTAVLQEVCLNFKDPGLQIYGGKLFQAASDTGDEIFRSLPAPEPSGGTDYNSSSYAYAQTIAQPAAQVRTMAAFHNAGGGCWAPGTKVRMAYGYETKAIEELKKGEAVWTPDGPALVEQLLTLGRAHSTQLMCHYNKKVWITPWHPVLNENGLWIQPASMGQPMDTPMPVVYNMILSRGHVIDVNSVLSVTLGHGFKGPIIEHAFFGDKAAVLRDIQAQPGFDEGRPVFKNLKTRNDPLTGLIVGWYDDV